ncbi:MAG: T9SS type B sorting domain-containing protein [Sphingomonadales bacterium]
MNLLRIIVLLACFQSALAQGLWLYPNKGQWDERILFNLPLSTGRLYVEESGLTYFLTNATLHDHTEDAHSASTHDTHTTYHAIKHHFIHAQKTAYNAQDSSQHYHNYFLGSDQSKWKSNIRGTSEINALDYFENGSVKYLIDGQQFAFHLQLNPNADIHQFDFHIEGADSIFIDSKGFLHLTHSFGEITYSAPKAWNLIGSDKKVEVPIHFIIDNQTISFEVDPTYNPNFELYIDPSLTFSTFTGSPVDNWGFTATPDFNGNLFGGGIVFGSGYPSTTGAYDATYNSGTGTFPMDVGITKFNATGTALLYSTYLGGSGNETPHSIVCAPNGELYVYGVTSSTNFPMAGSSYDNSFNGGPYQLQNSLEFNGSDIYIARFNPNGTALLSSTYVGGSSTDGLNAASLFYNYGDQFRGEIVLDANQNVYVSSTTTSTNFPTANGFQTLLNGPQDAVVFKMNPGLSQLMWSSYFGGSGTESGNSITIGSNGSVYVAGGTTSSSLAITGGHDLTFNGGSADGYALRINAASGAMQSGTYMGQSEYDQTYFIRTDIDNAVYVYGQSESAWAITPGCYGNANSGQFLRKYAQDLSVTNWTTMIGAGTGNVELSPTAFLISDCYDIYLAGWGGQLNQLYGQAAFSTTNNFPVTLDAFQLNTNGSNFYIAVLDQNASSLKYATFMGGVASSSNHVDGGTSRFDNQGRIYHAVCGGCGGNDFGFTSTPGVWSPSNPSSNCNLACFKFELSTIEAIAAQPAPLICIPQSVFFDNNSLNANAFFWDFGDGNTSSVYEPIHAYTTPGIYTVLLVAFDSTGCFTPDSVTITINIGSFTAGAIQPNNSICPGDSYQLEAYGGNNYSWSPANVLDNPNSPTPTATLFTTTTFSVIVSDSCGSDTLQVTVNVSAPTISLPNDTTICIGESVTIDATATGNINWSPGSFLNTTTGASVIATPQNNITYTATVTSSNGCTAQDSITISVFNNPPVPQLIDSVALCYGSSMPLTAAGGSTYFWYPSNNLIGANNQTVQINPIQPQYYFVDVTNSCGTATDSVWVSILTAQIWAGNDTTVCPGRPANLWASGALYYEWSPSANGSSANGAQVSVLPPYNTTYLVIGTDAQGCQDSAYVQVNLFQPAFVNAGPDIFAVQGDAIQLTADPSGPGAFLWSPPDEVSCPTCQSTTVNPNQNAIYSVYFTDQNGCTAQSQVNIFFDPFFYVPNTFTPDGDMFNQYFRVIGGNYLEVEVSIYDRWGELIYQFTDLKDYWDGTYNFRPCQEGTYTWKITYTDYKNYKEVLTGHVNLLR